MGGVGPIPPFLIDFYTPGTTIHFRAVARADFGMGDFGIGYGSDQIFTTLMTLTAPVLLAPQCLGGGQFCFTVSGTAGGRLELLATSDFQHWTSVARVINTTGSNTFTLPATNSGAWFYRVNQQ